jgi:hypothetical protein
METPQTPFGSLGDPELDAEEVRINQSLTPEEKLQLAFEISDFMMGAHNAAHGRSTIPE